MNQLWLLLGLKSEGFNAGLKRARDQVQSFEKDWKGLGKLFGAGGLTFAVINFFQTMIEHARQAKGEIDAQTEAVRNFGDGWDYITTKVKDFGVQGLGILARAGENLVDMYRYARDGAEEFERQDAALKNTAAGAAEAERNLAQANKHAAEFKAITAGLKREEQELKELRMKGLSTQEKYNALENEFFRLFVQRENFQGTALERRRLELELATTRNEMLKTEILLTKEREDAAKKAADEDAKRLDEYYRQLDRKNKAEFARLPLEEQVTMLASEEARLRRLITVLKEEGVDATETEADLAELLVDLDGKRADLSERLTRAAQERTKLAEKEREAVEMTKNAYEGLMNAITLGGHSSEDIGDADDDALKELRHRNEMELQKLRLNPGSAFNYGNSLQITRLENENRRIQRELDLRDEIQRSVAFGGVSGARRMFGGDPLVFDRLVDRFTREQDRTDKQIGILEDIRTQLTGTIAGNLPSSIETMGDHVKRGLRDVAEILKARPPGR